VKRQRIAEIRALAQRADIYELLVRSVSFDVLCRVCYCFMFVFVRSCGSIVGAVDLANGRRLVLFSLCCVAIRRIVTRACSEERNIVSAVWWCQ
jgi:hypothetical protein